MPKHIKDSLASNDESPYESPFKRVHGLPFFDWVGLPENKHQRIKFDIAMAGVSASHSTGGIFKGKDNAAHSTIGFSR